MGAGAPEKGPSLEDYSLLRTNMTKVTIFGFAGTGTSSTGRMLAQELRCEFVSSGNIFRAEAAKRGLSLIEFTQLTSTDSSYDKVLDQRMIDFGKDHSHFVVESWLAYHFIPDSKKIKLVCDLDERIERVARRDKIPLEQARKDTAFREDFNRKKYKSLYGIEDYADDSHFDLILDTTTTPISKIVAKIKTIINPKKT